MFSENLILMNEMVKKWSTDQRFILKEITSWKIHTLAGLKNNVANFCLYSQFIIYTYHKVANINKGH